jgi:hypothetical protein
VLSAAEKADMRIRIYSLDEYLRPDCSSIASVYTGKEAILLVNYFGMIDCQIAIQRLRGMDAGMVIVQDNVQAPFAMLEPTQADYAFTSFRKAFPVPDGAWAVARNHRLEEAERSSDFSAYKTAGCFLKGIGIHNARFESIYLDLLAKGERLIDEDYGTAMSGLSKRIIRSLDWNRIQSIRLRNAHQIMEGLKDLGITPLLSPSGNQVPLFIPVQLANRDRIRKQMFENQIFCPVHWPVHESPYKLKRGEEMARTELSLIVDQRYNMQDMQAILRVLERSI